MAKPKKKYYTVWKGHRTGVFETWDDCKSQIANFEGAQYKSFPTFENQSLLGIMENRLGGVIDDFRNKELYNKIVKVRICDIKFRRFVEVDESKNFGLGEFVEKVEVGRFLYGFLKYKKWKNKSWLKIVDEYDEWRKKNNKDDLFNFFKY